MKYNPVHLIGLCGTPGAGKTAVAQHLVDKHGYFSLEFSHSIHTIVECEPGTRFVIDGIESSKQANWVESEMGELWQIKGRDSDVPPGELRYQESLIAKFAPDEIIENTDDLAKLLSTVNALLKAKADG